MVERGTSPKYLMERSKGCQELGCCLAVCCVSKMIDQKLVPLVGCHALPFIDQGEQGLQMGERGKNQRNGTLQGVDGEVTLRPSL